MQVKETEIEENFMRRCVWRKWFSANLSIQAGRGASEAALEGCLSWLCVDRATGTVRGPHLESAENGQLISCFGHRVKVAEGGLVCCSPWGGKESDTTVQLNSNQRLNTMFSETILLVIFLPCIWTMKQHFSSVQLLTHVRLHGL